MALCAFSFPVHLNRATISGPRRSTPLSSSHYQWGADLLSHSHHRLDQVTSFSFSFIHQLTWTQSYCVGEGIPMMAMGEKNIALKVWTLISFALAYSSFHSHWKISFVWLALSSFVFPNFIAFFVIEVNQNWDGTCCLILNGCRWGKGHMGFMHHYLRRGSIIRRDHQPPYWIPLTIQFIWRISQPRYNDW